jgi:hypothetical protein
MSDLRIFSDRYPIDGRNSVELLSPLPSKALQDAPLSDAASVSEFEQARALARERLRKQSFLRVHLRHLLLRFALVAMRMARYLDS